MPKRSAVICPIIWIVCTMISGVGRVQPQTEISPQKKKAPETMFRKPFSVS
ncbi:hypothetical protein BOS5A_180051 [Bosea sp. EC-HK365B]|nr:hypothetical protein BOSE21B_80111 [Bosea sp. 21B]CAD5299947.1 hypothetical protein BOSE7B_60702 [Bosea sp. 7B]VVT57095.1 hypothetical protein BOS5A_180051 [Bosea sp. EC-HK365B]VXB48641.1 hypothetical protein BOSE127_120163 [Bosea sp. 127]